MLNKGEGSFFSFFNMFISDLHNFLAPVTTQEATFTQHQHHPRLRFADISAALKDTLHAPAVESFVPQGNG